MKLVLRFGRYICKSNYSFFTLIACGSNRKKMVEVFVNLTELFQFIERLKMKILQKTGKNNAVVLNAYKINRYDQI